MQEHHCCLIFFIIKQSFSTKAILWTSLHYISHVSALCPALACLWKWVCRPWYCVPTFTYADVCTLLQADTVVYRRHRPSSLQRSHPLSFSSLNHSVPPPPLLPGLVTSLQSLKHPGFISGECHLSCSITTCQQSVSFSAPPSVHTGAARLDAFSDITPLPPLSILSPSVSPPASLHLSMGMGWWGIVLKAAGGRKLVSHQSS